MKKRQSGISYKKKVADITRIYEHYAPKGLPNREIWLRFVYPVYGVSERTFYNLLKAPTKPGFVGLTESEGKQLKLFGGDDSN